MKKKLMSWLIVIVIISFLAFIVIFSKYRLDNCLKSDAVTVKTEAAGKKLHKFDVNASVSRKIADTQSHQVFSKHELPDKYFVPQPAQNTRVAIKNILQKSIAQMQSESFLPQATREVDETDD